MTITGKQTAPYELRRSSHPRVHRLSPHRRQVPTQLGSMLEVKEIITTIVQQIT